MLIIENTFKVSNFPEASQIIPQLAISKHSSQPADIAEEIQVSYI